MRERQCGIGDIVFKAKEHPNYTHAHPSPCWREFLLECHDCNAEHCLGLSRFCWCLKEDASLSQKKSSETAKRQDYYRCVGCRPHKCRFLVRRYMSNSSPTFPQSPHSEFPTRAWLILWVMLSHQKKICRLIFFTKCRQTEVWCFPYWFPNMDSGLILAGKSHIWHFCRAPLCFKFPTLYWVLVAPTAAGGSGKIRPVPNGCTGGTLRNVCRKRGRNFRNEVFRYRREGRGVPHKFWGAWIAVEWMARQMGEI